MFELYNGDCIDVMNSLIQKGTKVDAIITDIPYGTTSCSWDIIIPFDKMWNCIRKIRKENTPTLLLAMSHLIVTCEYQISKNINMTFIGKKNELQTYFS